MRINNNGIKISINKGEKILQSEKGLTLLSALSNNGIHITSTCNGKGICGLCRVKINSGTGALTPCEEKLLEKIEKDDNIRFSCQLKLEKDINIVLPDMLFK